MRKAIIYVPVVVGIAFLVMFGKHYNQRLVTAASPLAGPERTFAILFAYSGAQNKPKLSHTFATFVRTSGEPGRLRVTDHCTISWLPQSGIISLARPAEAGTNLSLQDTLDLAEKQGLAMSYIGPFEVRDELFEKAAAQAARLERGELKYKAFDHYSRSEAKNCIHAVSDLCDELGRLSTGTTHGLPATRLVARAFEPYYLGTEMPREVAHELLASLGVRQITALRHEVLYGESEAVVADASP